MLKRKSKASQFGVFMLVVLLSGSLLVGGCGRPQEVSPPPAQDATAAPSPQGAAEPDAIEAATIQIRGSDSEVNMVASLAEEFMLTYPQVQIAVTGGGSGAGIAALLDGTVDIANSSRPMKDSEIEKARANGVEAVAVRFAMDGVAAIVNENNPAESLSMEELGAIFRGEITNWSEVGGEDKGINLYGRQSNSGTFIFFMEWVLRGDYDPGMRNMVGNADILEAVRSDVTGIGYIAIGYATEGGNVRPGIKVLSIAAQKGEPPVSPLELENITSGAYPISRPLYQFVAGRPEGAIRKFLEFELSERGQEIVLESGFYPITDADREFNKNSAGIQQ
ncbi:MAG TPA: phosphate-binding protein [Firmicutes bacterium]|nr:phosphate-binding protein [Bacillota bacterium]